MVYDDETGYPHGLDTETDRDYVAGIAAVQAMRGAVGDFLVGFNGKTIGKP